MTGGQLSVFERLEALAHLGNVECSLNLYPRQAGKLLDEGFELKKIAPVYGRQGQHRYTISWRNATPGTAAFGLLTTAALYDEQLRDQISQDTSEPIKPPYSIWRLLKSPLVFSRGDSFSHHLFKFSYFISNFSCFFKFHFCCIFKHFVSEFVNYILYICFFV